MVYTPEIITSLEPNQIFVFGSNEAGIHGAGAAKLAHEKFGAIWGEGEGLTGQCYALPTKNKKIRQRTLTEIYESVKKFQLWACYTPHRQFLVTKIGCGLAGFTTQEIGDLFRRRNPWPSNVILPKEFQ